MSSSACHAFSGSPSESSSEPIPQRFIAAKMEPVDRIRAGFALGGELTRFLGAAANRRERRSPLRDLGLRPAVGFGVFLDLVEVAPRELPLTCVPLDVREIPQQAVAVGQRAPLARDGQLRLERAACAVQVAAAQKPAAGHLASGRPPRWKRDSVC